MTYYDRLNSFFKQIKNEPLNPSTQLLYLHLLHISNNRNNSDRFQCTDSELAELTRLSKDSITQAKRNLKNVGLIDFQTDKTNPRAGTLYILPQNDERPKSQNSPEILQLWFQINGEHAKGAMAIWLIEFENQYGTEKLKQALVDAAKGNKYERITYYYLKAILEGKDDNYGREHKFKQTGAVRLGHNKYHEETELPPGYEEG